MTFLAHRWPWRALALAGLAVSSALAAPSQTTSDAQQPDRGPRTRINGRIDELDRVTLKGNRNPRLKTAEDQGPADDAQAVNRMILLLMPDADQQAALDQYLAASRNPASPQYGQWLSTQEYERRFGVSDQDIATVVAWLKKQGFTIDEIPAGRRSIVFSGAVKHIRTAFQTDMRHFKVGQTRHLANATDPTIPDTLSAVVGGVVSLTDFRSRPMHASVKPAPAYNNGSGSHSMAAADFNTIYNLKPLLAQGIDGTGQTIAILGRTNIVMGDIQQFRSSMGLPANLPQVVITGSDPGRQTGDEGESDLDLEWAGAVAPAATIKFITSASTASTDGVDLSAQYAVSNNVADVISLSYGLCEADLGTTATNFYHGLWQQATAQGMTVFVSSGDSGAADCDSGDATTATRGKAVNGLCTSPYATCVGGTQFNDTANPAQYWASANAGNMGSVLSYIPEVVWNESANVSGGSGLWASGGGASTVFAKPSWQTGLGVPNDGKRDVPDVSLAAAGHDGYLVYSSDNTSSTRTLYTFGGTSAAAPSFAGIMALVNHKAGARQGNANPRFYQLAALQASGGPAYFHGVVGGNNSVPGVTGFSASTSSTVPTYNQATGLGSVDGTVLVSQWSGALPTTTATVTASPSSSTYAQSVTFTASVAGSGTTTPGGTVQFKDGSVNLGSAVTLSGGTASLNTAALTTGSHNISAVYSGDAANSASVSASLPFDVTQVSSAVSVQSSNATTLLGQSVTFTVVLSGKSVGGSLQFMDGSTVLATVPIVSCPVTFSTSALTVGTHSITVVYSGDVNNLPSTSLPITQTVNPVLAVTTTSVSASAASVTAGQPVTLTASVSGNAPSGTVQFMDGATALGSPVALSGGVASLTISSLAEGNHTITASYSGDAGNAPSVSTALVQVVTQASTGDATDSSDAPLPEWSIGALSLMLLTAMARRRPGQPRMIRTASLLIMATALSSLWALPSWAATLAGWDVHSLPGGTNAFGVSPLAASTTAANLTVGGLTRGSGVGTTGTAAARGWGGNDWITTSAAAAATAGDVVSVTLSANAGYQVSLGAVSRLDYRRSSTGPSSGVLQYQLGSGAFVDVATLSYSSTASAGASLAAIDLSGVAALQNVPAGTVITLRVVNHGGTSTGGTWYLFDTVNSTAADLEITGTVATSGPSVNGACGSAHGLTFPAAPVANLCAAGSASSVSSSGATWGWTCAGSNGGQTASCSAVSSAAIGCQ